MRKLLFQITLVYLEERRRFVLLLSLGLSGFTVYTFCADILFSYDHTEHRLNVF